MSRCGRCNRVLKNPDCIELGFGKICYRKMTGKAFPGKKSVPTGSKIGIRSRTANGKKTKVTAAPLFATDIVCRRADDGTANVNVPHRIVDHSPAGFEWGYGGSGPAELALNILSLFVGEEAAYPHHQEFKRAFIEAMPEAGGTIKKEAVEEWLRERNVPYGID